MSCDVSIRCLDCDVDWEDGWENHAGDPMEALASIGAALGAFSDSFDTLKSAAWCDVQFDVGRVHLQDLSWFKAHQGHRLEAVDQHGILLSECGAWDPTRGLIRWCVKRGRCKDGEAHDFQTRRSRR